MQSASYWSRNPVDECRKVLETNPKWVVKSEVGALSVDNSAKPNWPKRLAEHAFHGIAGEIVRAIEPHTESDPAALLIQFLVAAGNVIGRGPHFRVEGDQHYGNLFAVIVGDSSKSRKGTSWKQILRVFDSVDTDWKKNHVTSGLASGEGLIWGVRDPSDDSSSDTGNSKLETSGVVDKRLLIVEAEFVKPLNVMERSGSTLSAVLRDAWDTGDLRILAKNSPARATGALISILGHVTRDELLRHLNSTETSNGFANRFLWVCAKRSNILPEGGHFEIEQIESQISRLRHVIQSSKEPIALPRTEDAREIWRGIYEKLSESKPGLFGSVTGRAEAQVVRLSLIYALLDSSRQIHEEHISAAQAVWDYCEASARYIFGDAVGVPDADRILKALRATPGGLSRTAIRDIFGRHRSEDQISSALAQLGEYGMAHSHHIATDGRPQEVWLAT